MGEARLPKDDPRILFELGRGGMGSVHLGILEGHGGFQKLVAVKRLNAELARETEFLRMFLEEARLAARLNHPNVVQTHRVGFDGTHHYIEMEFLEGQSLHRLMEHPAETASNKRLGLTAGLWILAQALDGLHYAHELKSLDGRPLSLVHRDISPHNIFVTYDGVVKVLDFGIAKAADSAMHTSTGVLKGKVRYMAPEQALQGPIDRRADIFAFGVILWQMLTGQRLWSGLSDVQILTTLVGQSCPAPHTIDPDVPAELDEMCQRALAHEPAVRFSTAAEFRDALENYLQHLEPTVSRVNARVVGGFVSDVFGAERDAMRIKIERSLNGETDAPARSPEGVTTAPPPHLGGPGTLSRSLTRPSSEVAEGATAPARSRLRAGLLAGVAALGIAGALVAAARFKSAPPSSPAAAPEATRCLRTTDCAAAGHPDLACNAAGACVAPHGCRTNAECLSRSGGEASVCDVGAGACVPLAAPGCSVKADRATLEDDAALWVGAMFPLTGQEAEDYGMFSARAVELAQGDFMGISHGIPARKPGAAPRPIGVVMCDDTEDASGRAKHLVERVRAPVVIGFRSSEEAIDLATSLFLPKGVLTLTAPNRSSMLNSVAQPPGIRLLFRASPGADAFAEPMATFAEGVLEPKARPATGSTRVAFVRVASNAALSFGAALFKKLKFNQRSALENGDDYHEVILTEDAKDPVDDLLHFAPHVVLFTGDDTVLANVIVPLEQRWKKSAGPPPHYLTNAMPYDPKFLSFFGATPERRRRFLGIHYLTSTVANAQLVTRFNERYTPKTTQATTPAAAYDALYLAAYAAYAAGDQPWSGRALATTFANFSASGAAVDVGPTGILDAFRALREGTLNLNGAASLLDYDMATGEPRADFALMCLKVDGAGRAVDSMESGIRYAQATRRIEGTSRCP